MILNTQPTPTELWIEGIRGELATQGCIAVADIEVVLERCRKDNPSAWLAIQDALFQLTIAEKEVMIRGKFYVKN